MFDATGQIAAALVVPFIDFTDGSHTTDMAMIHENMQVTALELSKLLGMSDPNYQIRIFRIGTTASGFETTELWIGPSRVVVR